MNMYVDEIPTVLSSLKKLEHTIIAQRIVFEKVVVMPKGQQKKIKGEYAIHLKNVIRHVINSLVHLTDLV